MAGKTVVPINFAQGLDTKTDPWQVPVGKFLRLVNSIFQKGGRLSKRNGYGLLNQNPPDSSYITTFKDNLISIGSSVSAYSRSLKEWFSKGSIQPCALSTIPLIRNSLNQTQSDSVVSNGLVLTAFTETADTSNPSDNVYLYAIADSQTGQNIVPPTAIPPLATGAISGSSRVFVVGNFFVIVSQCLVGGTTFLQYCSIPIANPQSLSTAQNVHSEAYVPISSNPGWDGVVADETLVVAYNTTAGGQGVHVTSLTQAQIATNSASGTVLAYTNAAYKASILSICVDATVSPKIYYISFWNSTTTNGYTAAVYLGFGSITSKFSPQQIITATLVVDNIASAAQNNRCLVFDEVENAYSYDSGVLSNYINAVSVSSTGTVGTPYTAVRSVGLASKAFIVNGKVYFLAAYDSPFQPTYFLMNGSTTTKSAPIVVAKLAYENGGGYVTRGLPSVTVDGLMAEISYRFKDLVEALSSEANSQLTTVGGIYSQTGINQVRFELETKRISSVDLGSNLNFSGGFLGMFDGYLPVENNFFVWPDSVEVDTSTTGGSLIAQQYFYVATYEWMDNQGNIFRSSPSIPVSVTTTGSSSSNTISVPTLRLTYKIQSPVKIVIYRWSTDDQTYQQCTSISAPLLNDTTADSVAFVDTAASVTGNNILYTTGGVVPNTSGSASEMLTVFDTRLWEIDSEDGNLLRVSKQVFEGTPVDMNQLFTIYVSPNTGTVASTGPAKILFPMDDKLVIFKDGSLYYVNGVGPNDLGTTATGCSLGNYSQPIFITSVVGSSNPRSVVLTADGLMFQSSDKGIWRLGRDLRVSYIGAPVEDFNSSVVTSATVIPDSNYVLFTLGTGEILMYDYYYDQWGTFNGAPAISSCIYEGLHTLLTPYGEILRETRGQYLDNSTPVLMSFTTSWINLATLQGYERFYDFYILAQYLSPHKMLAQVAYDYNSSIRNQRLIEPKNFSPSAPSSFGVPTPFGSPGNKEQWKIDAKIQLCESFQLTITEVFDPSFGEIPGAGFYMSGLSLEVEIKKSTRPIRGANSTGLS